MPEARAPFQKRCVAGEVGAYGRCAGFDTGPHDHVHDGACLDSARRENSAVEGHTGKVDFVIAFNIDLHVSDCIC